MLMILPPGRRISVRAFRRAFDRRLFAHTTPLCRTEHLNALKRRGREAECPWRLLTRAVNIKC